MKIIFRACDLINSLHISLDGNNPRPFNLPKKEIVKIAARSLKESVKDRTHEFYLIGDRVSDETWHFLKDLLNPVFSFNSKEKLGDGGSLLECSKLAMLVQHLWMSRGSHQPELGQRNPHFLCQR